MASRKRPEPPEADVLAEAPARRDRRRKPAESAQGLQAEPEEGVDEPTGGDEGDDGISPVDEGVDGALRDEDGARDESDSDESDSEESDEMRSTYGYGIRDDLLGIKPGETRTPDELSEEAEALAALGMLLHDVAEGAPTEGGNAEPAAPVEWAGVGEPPPDAESGDTTTFLKGLVESILFVADRPLEVRDVARAARIDKKRAGELLAMLVQETRPRGIRVEEIAGGFIFRTNPAYSASVRNFLQQRPVRLSRAQIETLAIVAYRQPITRPEIDDIRGVDSGPVLKGLLERDLIRIIGKKDEPGRPMLYGTTPTFLEAFSLKNLRDLPTLREYTELTDESRQAFEAETGETAPTGPLSTAPEFDPQAPLPSEAPVSAIVDTSEASSSEAPPSEGSENIQSEAPPSELLSDPAPPSISSDDAVDPETSNDHEDEDGDDDDEDDGDDDEDDGDDDEDDGDDDDDEDGDDDDEDDKEDDEEPGEDRR